MCKRKSVEGVSIRGGIKWLALLEMREWREGSIKMLSGCAIVRVVQNLLGFCRELVKKHPLAHPNTHPSHIHYTVHRECIIHICKTHATHHSNAARARLLNKYKLRPCALRMLGIEKGHGQDRMQQQRIRIAWRSPPHVCVRHCSLHMYVCMCVCENACVIIIIIRIDRGVMIKLGIRDAYKYVAATTVYINIISDICLWNRQKNTQLVCIELY